MPFSSINVSARERGISAHILREMLKRGELPGFYSGNKFLVNNDALDEILREKSLSTLMDRTGNTTTKS